MIRLPPPSVILGFGLLFTLAPTRADIFHLKDGRQIRVEDWQETETQYVYGRYGGTVGWVAGEINGAPTLRQ